MCLKFYDFYFLGKEMKIKIGGSSLGCLYCSHGYKGVYCINRPCHNCILLKVHCVIHNLKEYDIDERVLILDGEELFEGWGGYNQ